MEVKYTPAQRQVIDARDCNVLVSAAAGSGKTAVLTQRIIERICDAQNPVSIDRILIVTFTEAAAAEMKERIAQALQKQAAKEPDNAHLQKQVTLIHNAFITTIHSFCLYLLRNHFHEILLDPSFRIAEEAEMKILKQEVVDALFEKRLEEGSEAFHAFLEQYGGNLDIEPAKERVLSLYEFSQCHAFPVRWMRECRAQMKELTAENIGSTDWMQFLIRHENVVLGECAALNRQAIALATRDDGPTQYMDMLEDDKRFLEELMAATDMRSRNLIINEHSFQALSRKSNPNQDERIKAKVVQLRDILKSAIKDWKENMHFAPAENLYGDCLAAIDNILTLFDVTEEFAMLFGNKKREKNLIDFSDMEHKALEILWKEEDGALVVSDVAREYQAYFDEVMVDEYQDSNAVQEFLLESVSRQTETFGNRFMVGDVKQSIYRFRLAKPEIFMEKYNTFHKENGKNRRIDLAMNFRSRNEVLRGVNAVFEKVMFPEVGGITYDEDARLYLGANYEANEQNYNCELLLWDKAAYNAAEADGVIEKMNGKEREAHLIADKIKELHENFMVTQKDGKTMRPMKYSDVVILLRAATGVANTMKEVLMKRGIPTHITSNTGYFSVWEVHLLLDFLAVLNNPRQDIPLYSVIHSFIGGLCEDEIAKIRGVRDKSERLYDSLTAYQEDPGDPVWVKINSFMTLLSDYRQKAVYMGVFALLEDIIAGLDYENYVSALPGGEQRRANVRLLVQKAKTFESTGHMGLFHFLRYIENMKEKEMDFGEANILAEDADVVRIMTIHKSKGLEFPVCFVARMDTAFKTGDFSDEILMDEELGVAGNYFDQSSRCNRSTIYRNAVAIKKKLDARGEDLRILYVAMTRAREKLILTGALNKTMQATVGADFSMTRLLNTGSFLGMCYPIALAEPDIFDVTVHTPEDAMGSSVAEAVSRDLLLENLCRLTPERKLRSFEYPHASLEGLFTKTTVSELKKEAYEEAREPSHEMFASAEVLPFVPSFIEEKQEDGGTVRGSAYHRVMELIDYKEMMKCAGREEKQALLRKEREEFTATLRLSGEWDNLVSEDKVLHFLQTDVAGRMGAADARGLLYREQPFVLGVPADTIKGDFPPEETVLIQGVIDVYFEEEGELVVLDYKTDRVERGEELVQRYKTQLDYYAEALEKLEKKKVKEKIIYSFALQEVIFL